MTLFIGLDVHSKNTQYCIEDSNGEILARGEVATCEAEFQSLFCRHNVPSGTRIGLETGTQAQWMAEVLYRLEMEPVVIDAGEVRRKARRRGQKSDGRDAFEICDGLRRDQWQSIVWLPPANVRQLREILSRRRHFTKLSTSQINAAKFILRSNGIRTAAVTLQSETAWKKLIGLYPAHKEYLTMHFEVWCMAQQKIRELDKKAGEQVECFGETSEILETCFGVGPVASASFIAAIGDPGRFPTSGHVVSYLGLAPSTYDSGETERHGHITHAGPRWMRAVLVECAHQARRLNHPLQPYFSRLMGKKGRKCAAVAVAARLARILWRMWRDGKRFDVTRLNVERKAKTRSKTTLYQIKTEAVAIRG